MTTATHVTLFNRLKSNIVTFSCLYLSSLSKSAKSYEIPREFDLIAGQGHPRSSILMTIESAYATSYNLLIVTLDVSRTVFEY